MKSYASIYQLLLNLRPGGDFRLIHVLINLTRLPGLRRRVLALMKEDSIIPAQSEIRSCGWLAQVDEYGGSIFHFRPLSNGAQDMKALVNEVTTLFSNGHPEAHSETSSVAA